MRGAILVLLVLSWPARTASCQGHPPPQPAFRFSPEASRTLATLWRTSVAAKEERVACLASTIRSALGREPGRPSEFAELEKRPQRFQVLPKDVAALKRYIQSAP